MKKGKKKEEGFLILIAIMISFILLSIGAFIANVSIREKNLAASLKASQVAFYAADSAIECANIKEGWSQVNFSAQSYRDCTNDDATLICNGVKFACVQREEGVSSNNVPGVNDGVERAKHVYYISFANKDDLNTTTLLTKDRLEGSLKNITLKAPYVKLVVYKTDNIDKKSYYFAYGHDIRGDNGLKLLPTERVLMMTR